MKLKISRIIEYILIIISTFIFALALYIKYRFGDAQIEQLLFSLLHSEGTSKVVIINALAFVLPIIIICSSLLIIILNGKVKKITRIVITIKDKVIKIRLYPIKRFLLFSIIVFLLVLSYTLYSTGTFRYLKNRFDSSKIFEDYYVNPNDVQLTFPKEKKNLIYIYIESMESSFKETKIDSKNENLIKKLQTIADDNISFSDNDAFGGYSQLYGADWTIASTVANTAGIPLKVIVNGNEYTGYSAFLPGVLSLGDILAKEGYKQYYMIGSDSAFAGRDAYFKEHGDFVIYDYKWAKDNNLVDSDYFVNWGFEDSKLFDFAKDKLLEISSNDDLFHFVLLTTDTHTPNGYVDKSCKNIYDYQYANSIVCSDMIIADFIKWIQEQDFYDNTTIVLVGDHVTMQGDIVDYIGENRYIYNAIINSSVTTSNNHNRIATAVDFFPTTLASIGVKIDGDRLGLGTNLFSSKQTLAEEIGLEKLNQELAKNSVYYNDKFLKNTYYEMLVK